MEWEGGRDTFNWGCLSFQIDPNEVGKSHGDYPRQYLPEFVEGRMIVNRHMFDMLDEMRGSGMTQNAIQFVQLNGVVNIDD